MANKIKSTGEGVALQVTSWARSAGLVEEDREGELTRLAKARTFSFDGFLLVIDRERVSTAHIAAVVASAVRDTKSVYRAWDATMQISGGGYQIQLPPAEDAGFTKGDTPIVRAAPGLLFISKQSRDTARLVDDLEATYLTAHDTPQRA